MCSESVPKDFEKTTEVLPFNKYGLSTVEEYRKAEEDLLNQEWLKKAGLTNEEIKLYQENEAGLLDQRNKIESGALKNKLETIYQKINNLHFETKSECNDRQSADQNATRSGNHTEKCPQQSIQFYPEGHPMNELKELEQSLFGHLKTEIMPITKRRKILRRLERKKERLLASERERDYGISPSTSGVERPGSLWDVKQIAPRLKPHTVTSRDHDENCVIGPKQRTMYTVRDKKIVRLEPVQAQPQEYRAVDIVVPVNAAETQLLEGTKMCLDDIKKIDRFKDYEPGIPSKVLYLKNIAPTVTQEQLSLLFNQFVLANGGPVDLRLMSGHMRGQAFAAFQHEDLAIQALEEINGTILSGRPVIAEFGRNTNRIQDNDNR
ncbi:unnamed protein product [Arctia plantaginis]|uniref:RRM domain-containing protein n=1 Tax=Arctia plantaginis TaxID=874455 RepID=A0A8S1B0Y2_ARCPL|nr:unnamed protein product [Arctia plantaginis]